MSRITRHIHNNIWTNPNRGAVKVWVRIMSTRHNGSTLRNVKQGRAATRHSPSSQGTSPHRHGGYSSQEVAEQSARLIHRQSSLPCHKTSSVRTSLRSGNVFVAFPRSAFATEGFILRLFSTRAEISIYRAKVIMYVAMLPEYGESVAELHFASCTVSN